MTTTDDPLGRGPIKDRLRRLFRWLLSLRGSPESIARGVAIGIFVACSPLLGIHFILAIVFATLLGGNRPAALAASLLNNPLTFVPVYVTEYWIGSFFWPGPPVSRVREVLGGLLDKMMDAGFFQIHENMMAVLTLGRDIFVPLLIGGTIFGLLAATATYFPILSLVRALRAKREKRRVGKEK
jgi:uncharacterized protein (DUF2062 family)